MFDQASDVNDVGPVDLKPGHKVLSPHPELTPEGARLLSEVADWLESGAGKRSMVDGFNMSAWIDPEDDCGTVCCIAGAVVCFGANGERDGSVAAHAVRLLTGGDYHCLASRLPTNFRMLFLPEGQVVGIRSPYDNDPHWAARTIRNYLATGTVNWKASY